MTFEHGKPSKHIRQFNDEGCLSGTRKDLVDENTLRIDTESTTLINKLMFTLQI